MVLALFLAGLGLRRQTIGGVEDSAAALTGDERVYWRVAANVKAHGVFAYETAVPTAFRAPLLPALLRLSQGDFSSPNRSRRILLWVWAAGFFALFAAGAFAGGWTGGLVAAAVGALAPPLVAVSEHLRTETLDVALLAVICALASAWLKKPSARSGLAVGLAVGVSLCARSTLFVLPLLLIVFYRNLPGIKQWGPAIILGVLLPLLPWAARNALHFREFVPLERRPAALGLYWASLGKTAPKGLAEYSRLAAQQEPKLGEVDTMQQRRLLRRLSLRNIAERPGRYLAGAARRFVLLWGSLWPYVLSAAAALWLARKRSEAWLLALLAAYYSINALLDLYYIRMAPALVPLALLIGVGAAEIRRDGELTADARRRLVDFVGFFPTVLWGLLLPFVMFDVGIRAARSWNYIQRDLEEPKVFLDRTVLLARQGKEKEALERLDAWAPMHGDYAALQMTYGALLKGAGRDAEAAAAYARAAALTAEVPPEAAMHAAAVDGAGVYTLKTN